MIRALIMGVAISTLSLAASQVCAAELTIAPYQTVAQIVELQSGQRVTLLLTSGTELTGTVKSASAKTVHLHALSGKEFFDAVVDLGKIEAVLIRTAGE
jgi:hypothetical protein